jgi:hypothetical protein
MATAPEILDRYFPEMRWRALSLAADLDRIDRAGGLKDPRLGKLRDALTILLGDQPDRAARVQMIFSDMTPPPSK